MASRSRAPAIGSAGWILQERHQSNALVAQELEDFGFSVRNELEWLNEHMADVCANDGQHNLEVFKTPGKLRGKTPRTARKQAAGSRQPLASLLAANAQNKASPAEQSLRNNLQKATTTTKARFQIAEDENAARVQSPAKTPVARQLFAKAISTGKENVDRSFHADVFDEPATQATAPPWSPLHSTQDTVMSSQADDVFSPPRTQSTQPTQPTQSFRHSIQETDDERRDTGDSFVSAKEAFGSKHASRENLRAKDDDAMDVDDDKADSSRSSAQDTVIRHDLSSAGEDEDEDMHDIPDFPEPPRVISEQYSISAETHDALDTAHHRAHAPEPKTLFAPDMSTTPSGQPPAVSEESHDDTVVHHDVDDQMDIDDDVRSPSDNSSPVKPLVRKSSLTFASLPAREPLLAKKSMGNRVSRTSHVDPSKGRNSQMGRYTGGKSLGGSQLAYPAEKHHDDSDMEDERPGLQREESETTKIHNKTTTQRLFERINMLKQQNEAPKRVSQNIMSSQSSQQQSFTSAQSKEDVPQAQAPQPAYPSLPAATPAPEEDDDDDWISPVRTAPAPTTTRPPLSKSHTADVHLSPAKPMPSKLISVSNPDLSTVVESTTPAGSPTGKKYMDGPLSASKAKFYSALRAAKEKIIGSSATSAQVKLDALSESPMRPRLQATDSSDDIFGSPKRTEKPGIFSHLRSPSKESNKSTRSTKIAAMPGSPVKDDGRRTRSSTERQKQKEKEAQDKDAKQKQRAEDKLREMREKEQSKAALHHQKSKGQLAKTPTAMSSSSSLRQPAQVSTATKTPTTAYSQQPVSRPGIPRTNTASSREQDVDSADEMPPPPPPKSLLPPPKTTKAALREPRKLVKPSSKEALLKAKAPQKIMVNLNSSRYGQAPPPAPRPAPTVASKPLPSAPATTGRSNAPVARPPTAASSRPASALSGKAGHASKTVPAAKPAAPRAVRPQPQAMEKPKAPAPQPRADLPANRPVSRMQTVQDANRIVVPPVNPAKPPTKRPFQPENDETLHRPAKRPSQQAKMNPITPGHAHAQFAKGKIPFAEPAHAPQPQPPTIQYPNGDDIKLPEIMTDSEDEDSENEFEQPSWVNTPNLREMLASQQLMDPEQIFGPIAPLNMEAVFPNKERHKRFRERTSSAFWANDQVTEEEKRKEREARERLVRDGAWTYNPSPRPAPGPSRLG
ncbi:hypothetical protein FB567DRAFT_482964 [Paraphoma chrysanthemicola]|uniref:Inner centromere protein ARK-binding domain-containing protein n=1 Tax=Paraphoma chrysanthemicola TaxID=798071 RepID=A0A8K0VRS5_9PLEO|nr:hypothetical protein FB567DRAFT_482964 [Paraphoma chrysanthemicola]